MDMNEKPWETEGDFFEWIDNNLHCMMIRHPDWKTWCGYVGVPASHSLYQQSCWENEAVQLIPAHEIVNFSSFHPMGQEDYWYFGFDCAHAFDYKPGDVELYKKIGMPDHLMPSLQNQTYRSMQYVLGVISDMVDYLQGVMK